MRMDVQRIHILPAHEAQKIAAGEVVERPANVVKELIENALDAGATSISIYLEEGGKKLIRCIDNGCGMSAIDARLSIAPHATSKISSVQDLSSLTTFGFRGEALASMASVCQMELITRLEGSPAIKLTIRAGAITHETIVAANKGTDITLKDLFYNVPARQKFLKTTKTEWNAIKQLIDAYALAYPSLHITLYHQQERIAQYNPAETIAQRASDIFESSVSKRLIALHKQDAVAQATMTGIISDHQVNRYDRSQLYFFVNNRWIKNHKLGTALLRGYRNVLPEGRFPYAAIAITVPPHTIDINIHPRKEEVQFLHPRLIEGLIEEVVAKALPQQAATPVTHFVHSFSTPTIPVQAFHIPVHPLPQTTTCVAPEIPLPVLPEKQVSTHTQVPQARILSQLKQTYIMIETEAGLMLIDQHAAHERILYETIGTRYKNAESIQLLFPELITLPRGHTINEEQYELLRNFGIEAEPWSENQIRISATPVYLKPHMLSALVEELTAHTHNIAHKVQAMLACKAAVKAGDVLNDSEMQELVHKWLAIENRLTCPHGRPTSWLMSNYEIEKNFKRIV